MSRLFAAASNQYLENTSWSHIDEPLTISVWFKTVSPVNWEGLFGVGNSGGTATDYFMLLSGLSNVGFYCNATNTTTSSGPSAGTWHHACGVAAADNDRTVYLDGGNTGTSAVSKTVTGTSVVRAGVRVAAPAVWFLDGQVAHAAIYARALDADQVAGLAAGAHPFAYPDLIFYAPLIRDEDIDIVGGLSLTAVAAPTIGTNPPVYGYAPPVWIAAPTAAAGTTVSVSDSASVTGEPSLEVSAPTVAASDSTVVSDVPVASVSAVGATDVSASDSISVLDAPTLAALLPGIVVSDSASLSETTSADIPIELAVSESIAPEDDPSISLPDLELSVSESGAVADSPSVFVVLSPPRLVSVEDTTSVLDAPGAEVGVDALISQSVSVFDSPSLGIDLLVQSSDSIDAQDSASATSVSLVSATETASVVEQTSASTALVGIVVSDAIGAADSESVEVGGIPGLTHEISVSDSITAVDTIAFYVISLAIRTYTVPKETRIYFKRL